MRPVWHAAALVVFVLVGCAERNVEVVQSVAVTPDGIVSQGGAFEVNLTGATPLPISNAVENRFNTSIVVTVVALVVDSDGRVHLRRTLADRRVLAAGATETFVDTLPGPWQLGMVLGISTDVETDAGPRTTRICTPLCRQCDQALIQQACEQLELLKREQLTLESAKELVGTTGFEPATP